MLLTFFLLLSAAFATPPDLTACEAALIYESLGGDAANQKFLRALKNDDGFAVWLSRRGITRESMRATDDLLWREFSRSAGRITDVVARRKFVGRGPESAAQRLLEDYRSEPPTVGSPLAGRIVHLPLFLRTEDDPHEPVEAYNQRVASLRAGDTVVFRDGVFELGEFLGQGNATVIFALPRSNQALRIPMISSGPARNGLTAQRSVKHAIESQPRSTRHRVMINAHSEFYEWLMVDRINGRVNAHRFIQSLGELPELERYLEARQNFRPNGPPTAGDRIAALTLVPAVLTYARTRAWVESRGLDPADRARLRLLLKALARNPYHQKQFLWDDSRHAWILVDWE